MSKFQTINSSGELNYPKVLPTLDLNFAQQRSLDPRITFTRSSGGTYVDQDGIIKIAGVNQPRFNHDPTTGECLGLLIEDSRTKISSSIVYPLGSLNTVSSTDIVAPDGTTTGITKITSPSFGSTSGLQQFAVDSSYFAHDVTQNVYYTSSIYVYATGNTNSSRTVELGILGGGCLDAAGGVSLTSCGYIDGSNIITSNSSFSVTLPQNRWVRVFLNWRSGCTSSAGRFAGQIRVLYWFTNNSVNTNFINSTGNPVMYLWGMSVETSNSSSITSFPTSFIYGTSVTRAADDIAAIAGTNFSSWYNQSEGTVFIDYIRYPINVNFYPSPWTIRDSIPGAYINGIQVFGEAGNTYDRLGGTNISNIPAVTLPNPYSRKDKNAAAFKSGDLNMAINGVLGTKSSNDIYAYGSVNQLVLASTRNFTLKQFTYYPKRLPDQTLQRLTE